MLAQLELYDSLKEKRNNPTFSVSNRHALDNTLPPEQLRKVKFYYKKLDVSQFEKRAKLIVERNLRRLTTMKIH
jgi:hypothetical protein